MSKNLPLAWRCYFLLDLVIFFFARDINRIIGRHRNVVKLQANYCPCEPFIIFKGKCPKWCTLRHNKWHFHITPKGQQKVCNSICVWSSTLLFSFALEKIRMWVSKVDSNTNCHGMTPYAFLCIVFYHPYLTPFQTQKFSTGLIVSLQEYAEFVNFISKEVNINKWKALSSWCGITLYINWRVM